MPEKEKLEYFITFCRVLCVDYLNSLDVDLLNLTFMPMFCQ